MTPAAPPPPEPPPPPHLRGNLDHMQDEEVLRFAPPEIRRLWKRMLSVETQLSEVRDALRRIEELLRARGGA